MEAAHPGPRLLVSVEAADWDKVSLMNRYAIRNLLFAVLLLTACSGEVQDVTVEQLHASYSSGNPVVLDVRTEEELQGELGHLEAVINIPVQALPERIDELGTYRKDTIFVICRSGNRSTRATGILLAKGYLAFNVEGGMNRWRESFGDSDR